MPLLDIKRFHVYRDDWPLLPATPPEARIAPLELCRLRAGDSPELLELPERDHDQGVYERRFARGDECFGLRHEGQLAALLWVVYSKLVFGRYTLKLQPCEAYFLDLYVHPDYRGKGLAAALYWRIASNLHQRGFERLFNITAADNHSALNFRRKLNGIRVDTAFTVNVAGRWRFGSKAPRQKLRQPLGG